MRESGLELFMVLLGGTPAGRNTEQHDVFFGVARDLASLAPRMRAFWPGVKLHVDAYEIVRRVGDFDVQILDSDDPSRSGPSLYFINFGGYRAPDFEEYHQKTLIVAANPAEANLKARRHAFYLAGQDLPAGERAHIDDKLAIDQVLQVGDLLGAHRLLLKPSTADGRSSERVVGYIPFSKLD